MFKVSLVRPLYSAYFKLIEHSKVVCLFVVTSLFVCLLFIEHNKFLFELIFVVVSVEYF